MSETLLDVPRAQRVQRVEYVRKRLWELAAEAGDETIEDLPLTEPMQTWLERVQAALVDETVTKASLRDLERAFGDYLLTLPSREAGELYRRVWEFDETKWAIVEATT